MSVTAQHMRQETNKVTHTKFFSQDFFFNVSSVPNIFPTRTSVTIHIFSWSNFINVILQMSNSEVYFLSPFHCRVCFSYFSLSPFSLPFVSLCLFHFVSFLLFSSYFPASLFHLFFFSPLSLFCFGYFVIHFLLIVNLVSLDLFSFKSLLFSLTRSYHYF